LGKINLHLIIQGVLFIIVKYKDIKMNNLFKIIIVIILIIFFFHLRHYLNIKTETEILQLDKPKLSVLEEALFNKQPTIITGIMDNWGDIVYWTPEYLLSSKYKLDYILYYNKTKSFKNILNTKKIKLDKYINEIINKNDELSKSYIVSENIDNVLKDNENSIIGNGKIIVDKNLYIGYPNSPSSIQTENTFINYFCQVYGTCRILLWNHSEREKLYPDDIYNPYISYSKIDFKNNKSKLYPNFNKSKYIEIIMNPGQILYIPPYCWYYIENLNRNIRIQIRAESIFSLIIKFLFEKWFNLLHKINLYKNNNCTCCKKNK
jgi:lysine-specific demethylase 8